MRSARAVVPRWLGLGLAIGWAGRARLVRRCPSPVRVYRPPWPLWAQAELVVPRSACLLLVPCPRLLGSFSARRPPPVSLRLLAGLGGRTPSRTLSSAVSTASASSTASVSTCPGRASPSSVCSSASRWLDIPSHLPPSTTFGWRRAPKRTGGAFGPCISNTPPPPSGHSRSTARRFSRFRWRCLPVAACLGQFLRRLGVAAGVWSWSARTRRVARQGSAGTRSIARRRPPRRLAGEERQGLDSRLAGTRGGRLCPSSVPRQGRLRDASPSPVGVGASLDRRRSTAPPTERGRRCCGSGSRPERSLRQSRSRRRRGRPRLGGWLGLGGWLPSSSAV